MISVISSTNRHGSNTRKVALIYLDLLKAKGAECQLIDLSELPVDVAFAETYGNRSEGFKTQFENAIESSSKFVFVIPEYNGGFPGILKLFVDAIPPKLFHGKKAGLLGVSSGHAGALRPMDQFSNVLNYLRVNVLADKPKLSGIDKAMTAEGELTNESYLAKVQSHANALLEF